MDSSIDIIAETLHRHHDYYQYVRGETQQQQLSDERALSLQYADRTTFELVQNAFDRCERHVIVALLDRVDESPALIVGNDGQSIRVDSSFDYDARSAPAGREHRSDFHALCSVHTSNKTPSESIGNKGVGFKSVFSLASRVQVWSQVKNMPAWWGMELHCELTRERWQQRLEEDFNLRQGQRILSGDRGISIPLGDEQPRPSFYFPLPLWSDRPPISLPDDVPLLVTFVVVPLTGKDAYHRVEKELDEIRGAHFYFVGLRKPAVKVHIVTSHGGESRSTWLDPQMEVNESVIIGAWTPSQGSQEWTELGELARSAEHPLKSPGVAIAWPDRNRPRTTQSKLYSYLPTQVPSPFGMDVHADFQLGIDRNNLKTEDKEPIGKYNRALLEAAAELHFVMILRHMGFTTSEIRDFSAWKWIKEPDECQISGEISVCRDDLWNFVNPHDHSRNRLAEHLEHLLFGVQERNWDHKERYEKWAKLASRFFNGDSIPVLQVFDSFWQASAAWLSRATGYGPHTATWRRGAIVFCDALRESDASVVPLVDSSESDHSIFVQRSVPLPNRQTAGSAPRRVDRRLFVRRGNEGDVHDLHLPEAVLKRGRSITAYRFPAGFDDSETPPTGAVGMDRWALLQELRQLPNDLSTWIDRSAFSHDQLRSDLETMVEAQFELLRFAAELFDIRFGNQRSPQEQSQQDGHFGPAWRAFEKKEGFYSEDALRAGRAIATLFLPTCAGQWEPARQLNYGQVDWEQVRSRLQSVPGLDLKAFVRFLGVFPVERGLSLVEDGDAGRVPPQPVPPPLVEAGSGPALIKLVVDESEALQGGLADVIREAWKRWIEPLVTAEHDSRTNVRIQKPLSCLAWYPVEEVNGASPPFSLASIPQHVALEMIVLQPANPDRRMSALWRVREASSDADMLKTLGAIPGLKEENLRKDSASPARRLLAQLPLLDLKQLANKPSDRQGLLDLFQTLLDAVARSEDQTQPALSLLAYSACDMELPFSERGLIWVDSEDAWLAPDNTRREQLRRFFPNLPVVPATLGAEVVRSLAWLAHRSISVNETVRHDSLPGSNDFLANEVRERLERLLPGLLAAAEVSRYLPQGVDGEDAVKRWHQTQFLHVADAWVQFSVSGEKLPVQSQDWLRNTHDDVIVSGEKILFDIMVKTDRPLPLRYFGEALAERLLNNRAVGALWAQILAECEDPVQGTNGLQNFLRKHGGAGLEGEYQRLLRPLSSEAELQFRARLTRALSELGCQVRHPDFPLHELRILQPADLAPPANGWAQTTEEDVQRCLNRAEWTVEEQTFCPKFACQEYNGNQWEAWDKGGHRVYRLLTLATSHIRAEEGVPPFPELDSHLQEFVRQYMPRVAFSPEVIAWDWLKQTVQDWQERLGNHDAGSIDALLQTIPLAGRYQAVQIISLADESGWQIQTFQSFATHDKRERPSLTPEQMMADAIVKAERGGEAEQAFAVWVEDRTTDILKRHQTASRTLMEALPYGWKARQRIEKALRERTGLGEALHIAQTWGSAGFDFIGLEEDEDTRQPVPVRYEVKGLPAEGAAVRIFLSSNELAVYRRVCRNGRGEHDEPRYRGRWRLMAIEPHGKAIDLTSYLDPLFDDKDGPMTTLSSKGFSPDGLILTIQRPQATVG